MNIFDYIHSTTIEPTRAYNSNYLAHKEAGTMSDHGANARPRAADTYDKHSIENTPDDNLHRMHSTYNDSDYSHIASCHCGICPSCNHSGEQSPAMEEARDITPDTDQEVEAAQERQKAANELSEAELQQLEKMRTDAIREFVITGRVNQQREKIA